MAKRFTVYLNDQTLNVLGPQEAGSLSGRLNCIVGRYGAIVRDAPALPVGEWCAIVDALRGTLLVGESGAADPVRFIWAELADADAETAQRWGVDLAALSARVRVLPFAQQCAIAEVVTAYWAAPPRDGETHAQALTRAGARLA